MFLYPICTLFAAFLHLSVIGGVPLFAATVAEAPLCVTGVGCVAPALTGAASASSLAAGIDSTVLMMAPYFGTQGANVLTSFDPANYPGEVNPSRDLTNGAALYGAATVTAGAVSKARGIISTVRSAGSTISGLVKDAVGGQKGVFGFGAKASVPSKTAVQELEVDAYKNLKAREVVGDGLEHDHIPSFAAWRTAKEAELGRPLTELETKTLYQNSNAVEVPRDVHIAGPTYGGKNTPAQIQQDAADLCGAVCRDTEALRANLNSRGYDSKLVDETVQKIVERNRNTGVIK